MNCSLTHFLLLLHPHISQTLLEQLELLFPSTFSTPLFSHTSPHMRRSLPTDNKSITVFVLNFKECCVWYLSAHLDTPAFLCMWPQQGWNLWLYHAVITEQNNTHLQLITRSPRLHYLLLLKKKRKKDCFHLQPWYSWAIMKISFTPQGLINTQRNRNQLKVLLHINYTR